MYPTLILGGVLHLEPRFTAAITEAVALIERRTDAEVVVVAVSRSGRYTDVSLRAALAGGLAALAVLSWSPVEFSGVLFPIYAAVAAGASGYAVSRIGGLTRRIAGTRRMRAQVREAAEAAFTQESVHGTRRRTGVLVYVSALEGRVEVLPDHGLLGRIPGARFAELDVRCGSVDELLAGLVKLGDLLAEHVPYLNDDNPNEVGDAPRVRG